MKCCQYDPGSLNGVCPLSDELVDVHVVIGAAEVRDASVVVVAEVAVRAGGNVADKSRPVG
jgi:hypothetical protein